MSDTTPIPTASERERFEAWVKSQPEGERSDSKWWCRQLDDGGYSCYEVDIAWRAYCAALSHPSTPQGWKLVPVDPTVEMLRAADRLPDTFSLGDEYRAMLNAAPPPPEQGGKG